MNDKFEDNKIVTGSSLDTLREHGIDVTHIEEGYESKDLIIRYGKQLREMRKNAGMTQSELADAADMAQADISRLEKGLGKVGPSLNTMSRLADACRYNFFVSHEPVSSLPHLANEERVVENLFKYFIETVEAHKANVAMAGDFEARDPFEAREANVAVAGDFEAHDPFELLYKSHVAVVEDFEAREAKAHIAKALDICLLLR